MPRGVLNVEVTDLVIKKKKKPLGIAIQSSLVVILVSEFGSSRCVKLRD